MSEPVRKKPKKDAPTTSTKIEGSEGYTVKYCASGNNLQASLVFELYTDTIFFTSIDFTDLNKSNVLYRTALAVKDHCEENNKALPYELRFGSQADPRFKSKGELERLVQTVCSRTQLILWDPKRLHDKDWKPKCPTCTHANCVYWGWAVDVKKLIGDGEEDVWVFTSAAKCKTCPTNKHFQLCDPEVVAQLPAYVQLKLPGVLTRQCGLTWRVLRTLSIMPPQGTSFSGICDMVNEKAHMVHKMLELEYLTHKRTCTIERLPQQLTLGDQTHVCLGRPQVMNGSTVPVSPAVEAVAAAALALRMCAAARSPAAVDGSRSPPPPLLQPRVHPNLAPPLSGMPHSLDTTGAGGVGLGGGGAGGGVAWLESVGLGLQPGTAPLDASTAAASVAAPASAAAACTAVAAHTAAAAGSTASAATGAASAASIDRRMPLTSGWSPPPPLLQPRVHPNLAPPLSGMPQSLDTTGAGGVGLGGGGAGGGVAWLESVGLGLQPGTAPLDASTAAASVAAPASAAATQPLPLLGHMPLHSLQPVAAGGDRTQAAAGGAAVRQAGESPSRQGGGDEEEEEDEDEEKGQEEHGDNKSKDDGDQAGAAASGWGFLRSQRDDGKVKINKGSRARGTQLQGKAGCGKGGKAVFKGCKKCGFYTGKPKSECLAKDGHRAKCPYKDKADPPRGWKWTVF